MERTEKIGLGVAVVGHATLFALLAIGFLSEKPAEEIKPKAIDISLVPDVALESKAPPAVEEPAQSQAPEPAPPEDSPPPEPEPEPAPKPQPAPPAKPPEPAPAPAPKPAPKAPPPPKKPPVAKPEKPVQTKAPPARVATAPAKQPSVAKGTGTNPAAKKPKSGGFVLDQETLKGLAAAPSKSKTPTPPGATMDAQAAADIGSAIKRQVQPCADRQVNPGPGASRIIVTIRLQLNRDGSLNGRPTVSGQHSGVDAENSRYVDAVDRNAIAAFMGCAPLRGLPPELYDVPRGWKTFSLRYKLPD
jgi:outer membrane biosynthesis protein TonB